MGKQKEGEKMNINKDGRTLYFSDEEIDNETNGEKKVFVTKRINGKESHVKTEKRKNIGKSLENSSKIPIEDDEIFNFNSEIVLGVNQEESKKENKKKKKNKNLKNKKTNNPKTEPSNQNHKKKKRKKKKINKKVLGFFSILLLIIGIIVAALTAPIFNITEIQVKGNSKVATNTIISLSGLKSGENIFKFNSSIEQKIKENRYIDTVQVSRKLPGTVNIKVEEREVKYQINLINSYVYIDKNGYILENASEKKNVPVIVRFRC